MIFYMNKTHDHKTFIMEKTEKIEILSYTYMKGGKKHKATARKPGPSKGIAAVSAEVNCNCGSQKCVNGKVWRCLPLDNEGTCAWFISDENC
ncbi:MAG: hypothetical protein BGO55_23690 [Sphingobacteriales bacterium 50-39]|nr:MAG: hypothetical protein BGO55_23690 [Sphingobacteriales bacterium 50-39]